MNVVKKIIKFFGQIPKYKLKKKYLLYIISERKYGSDCQTRKINPTTPVNVNYIKKYTNRIQMEERQKIRCVVKKHETEGNTRRKSNKNTKIKQTLSSCHIRPYTYSKIRVSSYTKKNTVHQSHPSSQLDQLSIRINPNNNDNNGIYVIFEV